MDIIKSLETRGESEESEQERIKREVSEDIEMAMEVHRDEPFHNERHPKNVGRDALRIVDIFETYTDQVTRDTRRVVQTAADGHDLVVDFAVAEDLKAFNYGQRIRFRGFGELMPDNVKKILSAGGEIKGNEEKSWEKIEEIVKKRDPKGLVYTENLMEEVKEGVAATYPEDKMEQLPKGVVTPTGEVFIRDPRNNEIIDIAPYLSKDANGNTIALHFSQPFLRKESKISTLSVAWGDIMYGGKVSFEKFIEHGNEEFREVYELLRKEVLGGVDTITPERKSEIAKAALGWISTQVGFLLWQKIEFHNRLDNFEVIEKSKNPKALKQALLDEYSMFDSNIIDSKKRVEKAQKTWGNLTKPNIYKKGAEAETKFRELLEEIGF